MSGASSTSPIATPIEMLDFEQTPDTVDALMRGFPSGQRPDVSVPRRVLELSGGQPLITMELLRATQKHSCRTPAEVDEVAEELVSPSGLGKDLQLFKQSKAPL